MRRFDSCVQASDDVGDRVAPEGDADIPAEESIEIEDRKCRSLAEVQTKLARMANRQGRLPKIERNRASEG